MVLTLIQHDQKIKKTSKKTLYVRISMVSRGSAKGLIMSLMNNSF